MLRTLAHGQKPHCWFSTLGRLSATFPSVDTSRCVLSPFALLRLFPRPETRSGSNPGGYLLLALVPPVQIVTAMSFHFAPSAPSLCLQPQVSFIKLNISPHTTGRFESKTCALDTTIRPARPRPLDTLYVFISVAFVSIRSTRGWPVEHPARRSPWPVLGSNFHQ